MILFISHFACSVDGGDGSVKSAHTRHEKKQQLEINVPRVSYTCVREWATIHKYGSGRDGGNHRTRLPRVLALMCVLYCIDGKYFHRAREAFQNCAVHNWIVLDLRISDAIWPMLIHIRMYFVVSFFRVMNWSTLYQASSCGMRLDQSTVRTGCSLLSVTQSRDLKPTVIGFCLRVDITTAFHIQWG